jgi:hypothetical protein
MMLQYPLIELFVRSRDIDMMIHAIKLLNNYTVKSSVGSRKAYNITIDDICKYWWCLRQNITANDIWRHIFYGDSCYQIIKQLRIGIALYICLCLQLS